MDKKSQLYRLQNQKFVNLSDLNFFFQADFQVNRVSFEFVVGFMRTNGDIII